MKISSIRRHFCFSAFLSDNKTYHAINYWWNAIANKACGFRYFGARVENRWVNNNNVGKYEVSPPQNITLAKGFAYLAATWDFVNFTIQSDIGSQLLEWVTPTKSPEETFFATLNMNPQFGVPGAFTGKVDTIRVPEYLYSQADTLHNGNAVNGWKWCGYYVKFKLQHLLR